MSDQIIRANQNTAIKAIALWAALYLALQILLSVVRVLNPFTQSLIATFPYMLLWLMVIASVVRLQLKLWEAVAGFLVCGVGLLLAGRIGFALGVNFLLMFAGAFLGYLVANLIHEPNLLLPVAIVAALVDTWGVYFGTTNLVLQNFSQVLGTVAPPVPVTVGHEVGPMLRVGFGDFVFLGIFLTAVQRFHMNYRRTLILLYTLLTAALVWVLFQSIAIPALVPMGMAVVVANVRSFQLSRQEWRAVLYLGAISYLILGAFLLTKVMRW